MKKRFVKLIALALVFIMAFSSLPVSAFTGTRSSDNGASGLWNWITGSVSKLFRPLYPAQALDSKSVGSTNVHVDAPRGALPADTELDVYEIADLASVQEAFDAASDERGHVFTAVDINFINNGEEVEPRRPVTVILDNSVIADLDNIRLVHFKGGADEIGSAEMETVEQFYVSGQTITFDAEDFSVYAVIGDGIASDYARLNVRFYQSPTDATPVYSVNVTRRDMTPTDIIDTIIEDPEAPSTEGNQIFCGWYVNTTDWHSCDYTTEDVDGQHTVQAIRDAVRLRLTSTVREGDYINVYAMVYNYFNVAYVDENGETTLDTEIYFTDEDEIEVTIQLSYAPYEQGYRFYGWQKDDGDDTIYQNGDTTTLTEPVTKIRAQVQKGYWLSFEENPGNHYSGASYVPPVFCENGVIPADAMPDDPTLAGYHLGDSSGKWFSTFNKGETEAGDVWANPFSFTGTIDQDTTVYAKWILDDLVNYTIIVWKQNINDDKAAADSAKTYDFAFSRTKEVAPNTPVADLINISEADLLRYTQLAGKTITVDGVKHYFSGFSYNETKGVSSKDTVVKPNGTTVVNLYYDRNLITVTFMAETYTAVSGHPSTSSGTPVYFIYTSDYGYCPIRYYNSSYNYVYVPTTSNSGTQYAVVYGEWYELEYRQNSNTGLYGWYYVGSDNKYHSWDGTRYTYYDYGNTTSYTYYTVGWGQHDEWTGLYDQPISKYNYTWPTDFRWMDDDPTGNVFISLMDCFSFDATLYGVKKSFNAFVYHFLQDKNGNYATDEDDADFTVPCNSNTDRMVFREFSGFSSSQYRVKLPSNVRTYYLSTGSTLVSGSGNDAVYSFTWGSAKTATDYHDGAYWTEWIDEGVQVKYSGIDEPTDFKIKPAGGKIEFRYERVKMPITFMYGAFVTGRDVEMAPLYTGELKHTDLIFFGASVDSYKKNGGEDYYDPVVAGDFTNSSFLFEGWYVDPGCTTPYDFAGKTMLQGGITVYAKFRQREFRVFLHVNEAGKEWDDVDWNDPDQTWNFRIAYDSVISDGNPIEGSMEGYVLVGWYTDAACTNAFNFSTRFTDLSMAGIAQEYGPTQKADPQYATEDDGTNKDVDRPWINEMVHLYAKWRKVLPGAHGIDIVYDAIEQAGVYGKTGKFTHETGTPTEWHDPLQYTDGSTVYSRTASTPDDAENYQFLYWVILDADGNIVLGDDGQPIKVYPGQDFEIEADYAVVTDAPSTSGNYVAPSTQTRGPVRGSSSDVYQAVSAPVVGHSYLIAYVSGTNAYLIGNTYYYTNDCPKAVSATVSSGEITGDYEQYLWTVTDNSSQQLMFQNATAGYLGLASDYYLNFGTSLNTWTFSNNKVVNTTSATSYTKIAYSSGYFDVTSGTGSNITFFELVNQGEPVTYTKVDTPVPGISYVIVQDGVDYALSGTNHANTENPESGKSWLNAVQIERSGNTVTILDSQASDLTWTAGGNATNGWTWQNVGNSKYLNYTQASNAYLTVKTSAANWQYTSDKYFYCAAITDGYNYMAFSNSNGYNDYTVAKTGSAIGIYALTHTLTITYVMSDGTTAPAAYTAVVPEGVAYSVDSPVIDGYNCSQTTVSGNMVTADVNVTVTYSPSSHTVTFKDWDGTVLKTQTVAHGDYATAPADPSRAGYLFTGWEPDPETTPVTEDLIITAQYHREGFFIVTFKDWNGRVLKEEEVERGHDATAPANPTREGFTFKGWDKDFTNVQKDLVVYATYSSTVSKIYTVTLRAVYGPRTQQEKTFITWHANNNTGDTVDSIKVIMNENIPIQYPEGDEPDPGKADEIVVTEWGDLIWAEHVFLGWARVEIGTKETGVLPQYDKDKDEYVKQWDLDESDLFLKYVSAGEGETHGKFLAEDPDHPGTWVDVQYIAADELMPYHGMYAVWADVFYVYHSGTNDVERVVRTKNGKYDITQNVDKNTYLYGGYYDYYGGASFAKEVGGKSLGFDAVTVSWNADGSLNKTGWTQTKKDVQTVNNETGAIVKAKAYNGANVKWDSNAYTVNGMAMTPEAGKTYYIKEVPAAKYLRPYLHYTYYLEGKNISTAWLISDLDVSFTDYQEYGFVIVDANNKAQHICKSLTITTSHGNTTETLTAAKLFGARGYLDYTKVIDRESGISLLDNNQSVAQYWVTPDGLIVTGTMSRVYTGIEYHNTIHMTETPGASTIAVFPGN